MSILQSKQTNRKEMKTIKCFCVWRACSLSLSCSKYFDGTYFVSQKTEFWAISKKCLYKLFLWYYKINDNRLHLCLKKVYLSLLTGFLTINGTLDELRVIKCQVKKKEQKLINTNFSIRHNDVAISRDQQLWKSSFSFIKTCL